MATNPELEAYVVRLKARLEGLKPIFAKAAVGDFSEDVFLPEENDEFLELYTGVQVMLDVIRNQTKDARALNRVLEGKLRELRWATVELERERAVDEAVFASLGDGLMTVDVNGRVVRINSVAEDLLGWKASELVGKSIVEAIVMEDMSGQKIPPEKRPIKIALAQGAKLAGSYWYYQKGGKKILVSVTVTPIMLNGVVTGSVELFREMADVDAAKQ